MDTLKFYPTLQQYTVQYMERESERVTTYVQREKVHIYWLQRALDVFCRSLRDADARIRESSNVGLPVDYQRYLIHGRRILHWIHCYDPRGTTELAAGRMFLEQRLDYAKERFDELQSQMSNAETGGSQRFSVFDRANSLSESDSGTISSQTASQTHSQEALTPPPADDAQQYLSRVQGLFPPHDLPYPVEDEASVDDNGGVTPRDDLVVQHKGNRILWSPAEVGINHDHAAISSFHATGRKPSRRSVSASSDAEASLLKVRQTLSRSPSRRGGLTLHNGRSASSGSRTTATDFFRVNQGNYASLTPAGLTPSEELSAAEFYTTGAAPSRKTSTTLVGKVKENWNWMRRRRASSSASTTKPNLEAPTSAKSSPGVRQTAFMPSFPAFVDRSVSSSPGQGINPFAFPETKSTLTEPYQPSLPRVDSSSLDPMAMSFPPHQYAPHRGGAFLPLGSTDPTSMSRGSSRQSSNASRGRQSGDFGRGRGTSVPQGSADHSHRAASPFSGHMSSTFRYGGDVTWDEQDTTFLSDGMETTPQFDVRRPMGPPDLSLRIRRGSVTSAVFVGTGGPDALSDPYALGHARMNVQVGSAHPNRSRQNSNASSVGQQAAVMPPMPSPSEPTASNSRQNADANRRAVVSTQRGGGRGRGRGRTQSQSPSAEVRMLPPSLQPSQGSPEPSSEPMSRGGSGGLVVGSGHDKTLVTFGVFGDTTAQDLHDASRRLRQHRIDRQQPPGIPPRRGSVSSSRGSYRTQISPPLMSRGNSSGAGAAAGVGTGLGIVPGGKTEEKK